jgi:hypothetical protein
MKWVLKMTVVIVALVLFGFLGLYDATMKYPERGERYASWAKWQYLDAARNANTEDFGVFERESSVTNPVEELARLKSTETRSRNGQDAGDSNSSRTLRANMQMSRLLWLDGLKTIGQLDAEHTTFDSPRDELEALATEWGATTSLPKPLKSYDIPMQWVITFVCFPLGIYILLRFLRVKAMKYSWDESAKEFTVPSGAVITPADLEEVDKRKWDKFIVFLKLKDSHPTHGGKEIRVDTYQHKFVEDWILEMEAEAFGPQEDDDEDTVSMPENNDSDD